MERPQQQIPSAAQQQAERMYAQQQTTGSAMTPDQAARLGQIKQRAGWMPIEHMMVLAKANASDQAVDAAATAHAKNIIDAQADETGDSKNWFARNVYDRLKAGTRWTTAAWDFIPEFVVGGVAQFRKPGDTLFQEGWFTQTTLGSMLKNPELRGEGFFKSQALAEKQGERARKYRGTVNGSGWTIGRGAANMLFKADSLAYNVLSGVIDAAVLIKMDPTGGVSKLVKSGTVGVTRGADVAAEVLSGTPELGRGLAGRIKYGTLGDNLVPLSSQAEVAPIKEALTAGASLIPDAASPTFTPERFTAFAASNGRMQRLIGKIAREKNPLRLKERVFKDRVVPNEVLVRLADAESTDEVTAVLSSLWTIGRGSLPTDIRMLQAGRVGSFVGDLLVERIPLVDGLRRSRYFTQSDNGMYVVQGGFQDNANAVQSAVNQMRTVGVAPDKVDSIAARMMRAFSAYGTDIEKKKAIDIVQESIEEMMRHDGMSEEAVRNMMEGAKGGLERVRRYLLDRMGQPSDNGYIATIINETAGTSDDVLVKGADQILQDLRVASGGNVVITSPTELVELLDRMVVLPSTRELRMVTRNRFFRRLIGSTTKIIDNPAYQRLSTAIDEIMQKDTLDATDQANIDAMRVEMDGLVTRQARVSKLPIGAKRTRINVRRITDEDEYYRLGGEINQLMNKTPRTQEDVQRLAELKAARERLVTIDKDVKTLSSDQRMALQAIDFLQNKVWKTTALATGGYILRNTMDAQVRMALGGFASIATHPFEYIALALGMSKKMTLKMENLVQFDDWAPTATDFAGQLDLHREVADDVAEAYRFNMQQQGYGEVAENEARRRAGGMDLVTRADDQDGARHTSGVAQNLGRSHTDTLRRVVAQTFIEFAGDPDTAQRVAIERVANLLARTENATLKRTVDQLHENGFEVTDVITRDRVGNTGPIRLPDDATPKQIKEYYGRYAETIVLGSVGLYTGNIDELAFVAAFGYVPITDASGRMANAFESVASDLKPLDGKSVRIGSIVETPEGGPGIVMRVRNQSTGELEWDDMAGDFREIFDEFVDVQPVHPDQAFGIRNGSQDLRNLINAQPIAVNASDRALPAVIKYESTLGDLRDKGKLDSAIESMDAGIDWFFNNVAARFARRFERSPVYRQAYYREIYKHANRLAPEEAAKVLKQIEDGASELGISVEKYVGDKKILESLERSTKTAGDVKVDELDEYAKWSALQEVKDLLYDASARTNIEDMFRIIMPFASAWKEILGTYARFLSNSPVTTSRSFQRIYTGAQGADPDNDGRGMFYKDPQTGQLMFAFPGSGLLAKALTGLDAPLEAPVRRFSQGIQIIPSLGPVGQVAASKILPFVPGKEFLTELFLPYGAKGTTTLFNPTPQWADKLWQAVAADETRLDTVYANTYIETARALSASGDYDLDDKADVAQMWEDAKFKAQILTGMRAASQFIGPTSGATEFRVPTEQGDMYVGELIRAFYDMQNDPAIGYDNAVPQFLATFGDEVAFYVGSKSRSVAAGLEATEEFQDWADSNGDLIRDYPTVARYLAPAGSDFSFAVWNLQLMSGERERLSGEEILELAQQRVGSALYRQARKLVGGNPSPQQRALLQAYRAALHDKYPGFPQFAEFKVGEFYNDVLDLKELVSDPRTAADPTARAVGQYLAARDAAIQASGKTEQGFRSAKGADNLRGALEQVALVLGDQYPGFSRIYDRLLASELE
jgi:hypothetical protein